MQLQYLKDLWNEDDIKGMDEAEILRYRSNLLGADLRLTNFGGGNTSAKLPMTDPVTGETVRVLWVKGSGGDLGTIKRDGFATLYMDKLNGLLKRYRGVEFEDEMVALYPLCTFNNNPRAASIDTPLHAYLPFPHVDHLHPDWAIALAACANGPAQLERLKAEQGIDLVWLPWKRPGFELGLWLHKAVEENPNADGIILGSHGLFTWGNTARESYLNTLRVIDGIGQYLLPRIEATGEKLFRGAAVHSQTPENRAALVGSILPVLRGQCGGAQGVIGHFSDSDEVLRFVNSNAAKELAYQGTSCPDHFIRTKVRPLYVEWTPTGDTAQDIHALAAAARAAFPAYRDDYAAYYTACKHPDSPAMRSPNPTVVLVPGVGMFSFGRSKAEARITGEFYTNAIHVMEGATALDDMPPHPDLAGERVVNNYVALAPQEAFNIEYWLLEEAKIQRMPPEKELSRKVALVVGAGPGIGLTVAERLAKEGAHVVLADINGGIAQETAQTVQSKFGKETAAAVQGDCTDRESVRQMLAAAAKQFGGVDIVVQVAAVFIPPDSTGHNSDAQWRKTFEVNVLGSWIVAEEAAKLMAAQESSGNIILVGSANAVVAKKGSIPYDTSKAAVNHLVREMAVEFAPHIRVNGVAPASVVEGSQMFPRERVMTSLQKYSIAYHESESDEALRSKLAQFYASRTLLKKPIVPKDIAEAVYVLASRQLSATTGQILPVDAGLTEAFLR